jgi:hypothetical protein
VLPHQIQDTPQLGPTEATALLKPNGVEPDLGPILLTLDVNVRRLLAVAGEEEEAVRPSAENGWHASTYLRRQVNDMAAAV